MSLALLKKQIEKGRMPHAYLFSGDDEAAKEKAVEAALKSVLGVSFKQSPDFREINQESITIEDIRILKSQAYGTPLVSPKNVFLIRNIENLSREAAPALLKILEEPPPHLVILTTTSASNLIPNTIKSRLSKINFQRSSEALAAKKPKALASKADLRGALEYAAGLMRKSPSAANIDRLERLLKINYAFNDPTVNKRLLNEYFTLII